MKGSYLVQRLRQSHGERGVNPFSFGGGLRNGGLSDEAMGLLKGIFSFDYMGAAEYEFGAVPDALRAIALQAEAGSLEAFEFSILNSKVAPPWRNEANPPAPRSRSTIYVLAPQDWHDEVVDRIEAFASKNPPRTKMGVGFSDALRPGEYGSDTLGWLELDNGFMWFIDRDMWAATATLFGVEVLADA